MSADEDKLKLTEELEGLIKEEKYTDALNLWAASDELLDYKQEEDYYIAHAVTKAYVYLNDYDNAFFYARFQIDYILNRNTELSDFLGFYMLVLINYYKQKKKLWELARVIMEKEKRGVKIEQEVPELNKVIDDISKQPNFQKVSMSIAILILLLFTYSIYQRNNGNSLPEWLGWIKDGLFFTYFTYVLITPFRRWLIKGWVKQFVKIY